MVVQQICIILLEESILYGTCTGLASVILLLLYWYVFHITYSLHITHSLYITYSLAINKSCITDKVCLLENHVRT